MSKDDQLVRIPFDRALIRSPFIGTLAKRGWAVPYLYFRIAAFKQTQKGLIALDDGISRPTKYRALAFLRANNLIQGAEIDVGDRPPSPRQCADERAADERSVKWNTNQLIVLGHANAP